MRAVTGGRAQGIAVHCVHGGMPAFAKAIGDEPYYASCRILKEARCEQIDWRVDMSSCKPLGPLHAGSTAAWSASRRAVSRQTNQAASGAASRATTQGSRGGGASEAGPEAGQSGLGAHSNHMPLAAQFECAALCLLLDLLVLVIRKAECGRLVACDLRGSAEEHGSANTGLLAAQEGPEKTPQVSTHHLAMAAATH